MDQNLWTTRELPILRAIAAADAAGNEIDSAGVINAVGLDVVQVGRGLEALIDSEYLSGVDATSMGDPASVYLDLRLRSRGREALGSWNAPPSKNAPTGSGQILEVLIASPSDTVGYRKTIEQAIYDWNSQHAIDMGTVLLPRRWERDAHPAMGASPQQIVNEQIVDRSAILFGVFWARLGTPTDDADSGTAEEIDRFSAAGKPTHVYFSKQPVALDSVDTVEYERLKQFKKSIESRGLIGSFTNSDDLYSQVLSVLTKDVRAKSNSLGPLGGTVDSTETPPHIDIRVNTIDSGFEVIVVNSGLATATDTKVALEGGLFMLNAAHERIGADDSMVEYDDVGTLSPGSSRRYTVVTAWQTPPPRVIVTAAGLDPIEVSL